MIPTASASKIFSQRLLLILGIATVLALFFATKDYLGQREMGRTVTLGKDVWWKAMEWYGWALLSPAILRESIASSDIENVNTTMEQALQQQLFPEIEQRAADKEVLRYGQAMRWGFEQLPTLSLSSRLIVGIQ